MGQVLQGSARTTSAIRAAIQRSQERLQTLAARHGINPKTVAKWRKRTTTTDAAMEPTPVSTVLTVAQEAIIVAFRKHTLLPHHVLPGGHSFDRLCREYGVEHRLTKPAHPWTNG